MEDPGGSREYSVQAKCCSKEDQQYSSLSANNESSLETIRIWIFNLLFKVFNFMKKMKKVLKKKHGKKSAAKKKLHAKKEAKHIVKKAAKKTLKKGESKVEKVMHEYKEGKLHSGSKKGPKVKNPKQAIAIALSEARKSGAQIKKK